MNLNCQVANVEEMQRRYLGAEGHRLRELERLRDQHRQYEAQGYAPGSVQALVSACGRPREGPTAGEGQHWDVKWEDEDLSGVAGGFGGGWGDGGAGLQVGAFASYGVPDPTGHDSGGSALAVPPRGHVPSGPAAAAGAWMDPRARRGGEGTLGGALGAARREGGGAEEAVKREGAGGVATRVGPPGARHFTACVFEGEPGKHAESAACQWEGTVVCAFTASLCEQVYHTL